MINILELIKSYFWNLITALIILLVGFSLGLLAKKLLQKIFKEVELNRIMLRVGFKQNIEYWVSSILSYIIYLITIVFFLNALGITSIVLYLLVGAILMLLILTFLVGLKDVIPNFIGWFYLQRKNNIKVGREINIREIKGRVEKIGYLETEIKTESDDILYVPNALFLRSKVKMKN